VVCLVVASGRDLGVRRVGLEFEMVLRDGTARPESHRVVWRLIDHVDVGVRLSRRRHEWTQDRSSIQTEPVWSRYKIGNDGGKVSNWGVYGVRSQVTLKEHLRAVNEKEIMTRIRLHQ
jgi:hypothetical protein